MTDARKSELIVTDNSEKHIARLEALQVEIQEMGKRAPTPIIKKRKARYRMPRLLKQQLLDRFVEASSHDTNRPKVMIIAAHQDDETVGAGARLCTLSDAWIVHVTDGSPADERVAQRYGFNSRDDYAAARRAELDAALDVAGILPEHRLCLNYIDGEAALRMVDLVLRIADLLDSISPDVVITHPYEGGHTDHDATAFAVHLACGLLRREGVKPPAVLEMTSYFRREGRRIVHDFIPHKRADIDKREVSLDPELQSRKQKMYDAFQTQQRVIKTFNTTIEKFRPAPRYVFTLPPHEGELNYERFGDPMRGERWRRDAEAALAELKLRRSA